MSNLRHVEYPMLLSFLDDTVSYIKDLYFINCLDINVQ